nr:MAG TPA: hypothetical protein [Caudoviricetes sp.]
MTSRGTFRWNCNEKWLVTTVSKMTNLSKLKRNF